MGSRGFWVRSAGSAGSGASPPAWSSTQGPVSGPLVALDLHLTACSHARVPGDGQPEACTAEPPGGGVLGLGEGLEDRLQLLTVDSDSGVLSLDHELFGLLHGGHPEVDVALLRELHGAAEEVHEDLAQATLIAGDHVCHFPIDVAVDVDVADRALRRGQGQRVAYAPVDREGLVLVVHGARVDLRDVVDDEEEVSGGALDGRDGLLRISIQLRIEGQLDHADDPIHRRAELVARVGQEEALGVGGVPCLSPGSLQLLGLLPEFADGIAGEAERRPSSRAHLLGAPAGERHVQGDGGASVDPEGLAPRFGAWPSHSSPRAIPAVWDSGERGPNSPQRLNPPRTWSATRTHGTKDSQFAAPPMDATSKAAAIRSSRKKIGARSRVPSGRWRAAGVPQTPERGMA